MNNPLFSKNANGWNLCDPTGDNNPNQKSREGLNKTLQHCKVDRQGEGLEVKVGSKTAAAVKMPSREKAEERAVKDFMKYHGKVIEVTELTGHNDSGSHDIDFETPIKVRVLDTPLDDLKHWNDEYLDPYWNVEPLEDRPELRGLRSFWTFGVSYVIPKGNWNVKEKKWEEPKPAPKPEVNLGDTIPEFSDEDKVRLKGLGVQGNKKARGGWKRISVNSVESDDKRFTITVIDPTRRYKWFLLKDYTTGKGYECPTMTSAKEKAKAIREREAEAGLDKTGSWRAKLAAEVKTAKIRVMQGEDTNGFHMLVDMNGREYVLRGADADNFHKEYAMIQKPEAQVNALVEKYLDKLQPYSQYVNPLLQKKEEEAANEAPAEAPAPKPAAPPVAPPAPVNEQKFHEAPKPPAAPAPKPAPPVIYRQRSNPPASMTPEQQQRSKFFALKNLGWDEAQINAMSEGQKDRILSMGTRRPGATPGVRRSSLDKGEKLLPTLGWKPVKGGYRHPVHGAIAIKSSGEWQLQQKGKVAAKGNNYASLKVAARKLDKATAKKATGEMSKSDVTREAFPTYWAIADALGTEPQPFDVYQGPYIPTRDGRLWLIQDGEFATVYNEQNKKESEPFHVDSDEAAVDAALSVMDFPPKKIKPYGQWREDEAFQGRPDLPHDADCGYRLSGGSGECTCGKDYRTDEAEETPKPKKRKTPRFNKEDKDLLKSMGIKGHLKNQLLNRKVQ